MISMLEILQTGSFRPTSYYAGSFLLPLILMSLARGKPKRIYLVAIAAVLGAFVNVDNVSDTLRAIPQIPTMGETGLAAFLGMAIVLPFLVIRPPTLQGTLATIPLLGVAVAVYTGIYNFLQLWFLGYTSFPHFPELLGQVIGIGFLVGLLLGLLLAIWRLAIYALKRCKSERVEWVGLILSFVAVGVSAWWFITYKDVGYFNLTATCFAILAVAQLAMAYVEGVRSVLGVKQDSKDSKFENKIKNLSLISLINVSLYYVSLVAFAWQINVILALALYVALAHFTSVRFTNFGYQVFWLGTRHVVEKTYSLEDAIATYYTLGFFVFLSYAFIIARIFDIS